VSTERFNLIVPFIPPVSSSYSAKPLPPPESACWSSLSTLLCVPFLPSFPSFSRRATKSPSPAFLPPTISFIFQLLCVTPVVFPTADGNGHLVAVYRNLDASVYFSLRPYRLSPPGLLRYLFFSSGTSLTGACNPPFLVSLRSRKARFTVPYLSS